MVLMNELTEEKTVNIYLITDRSGSLQLSDLYEVEVEKYRKLGYTINTFQLPTFEELPEKFIEFYNKLYLDRTIIDSIIDGKATSVLLHLLFQITYQGIADFSKDDWIEAIGFAIQQSASMSDETINKIISLKEKFRNNE